MVEKFLHHRHLCPFMASCLTSSCTDLAGTRSPLCCRCTTSGCSRQNTTVSLSPSLSPFVTCSSSLPCLPSSELFGLTTLYRQSGQARRITCTPASAAESHTDWVSSKVVPTAVATGGDIGLSNLSLKTITLTLYTMCKSSALIFVLGFAFLFKLEKFSYRLVGVITFISVGVFFMVFNVTAVSVPGIIMVFSASAIGGLRWALTSLLMHRREMGMSNPFATIYWLAPLMALSLAIVSIALEGWIVVLDSGYFNGWASIRTILVILFPGVLAFSMVSSEY